jgi:nicotinate phosphoribosyltransferase
VAERVSVVPPGPSPAGRELLRPLVRRGEIIGRQALEQARQQHRDALAELPVHALQLSRGYPAIPTVMEPDGD